MHIQGKGKHALVLMLLILAPSWTSRTMEEHQYKEDMERHHSNKTSDPLSLILTIGGVVSAGKAVYDMYQSHKKLEKEKQAVKTAEYVVEQFQTTHVSLCESVHDFVKALVAGGQAFEVAAHTPSCPERPERDFLTKYLAAAKGKPFGNEDQVKASVDKICSEGFTTSDAIELKVEIAWWMGTAQGLGCNPAPVDDSFLKKALKGSSALLQTQGASLQTRKLVLELIGIGLFVVAFHNDAFSALGVFEPEKTAADRYEDFTTKMWDNMQHLSCRLSYPMYLRSLGVEALQRGMLVLERHEANPALEDDKLDICDEPGFQEQCKQSMVCYEEKNEKKQKYHCLRTFASVGKCADGQSDEICLNNLVVENPEHKFFTEKTKPLAFCKVKSGQFYRFCGASNQIEAIVPAKCFSWEEKQPRISPGQIRRGASPIHYTTFAIYQDSDACSQPFKQLKEASQLVKNFESMKTECKWPDG